MASQQSIKRRFNLFLGVLIGALFLVVTVALATVVVTVSALESTAEESSEELRPLHRLQMQVRRAEQELHHLMLMPAPETRSAFLRARGDVDAGFDRIAAGPYHDTRELTTIEAARGHWRRAQRSAEPILSWSRNPEQGPPLPAMRRLMTAIDETVTGLDAVYQVAYQEIDRELQRALVARRHGFTLILATLAVGLLFALGAALSVRRKLLAPIAALQEGAERLGDGDLDHRLALEGDDEVARLGRAFNRMADQIRDNQHELERLSAHDGLTGLLNHSAFLQRLSEEFGRARRYGHSLTLLMADLDHFKHINDKYGHPVGDRVLHEVGQVLRAETRPSDHTARYGGEEFAVLMAESDTAAGIELAERIRRRIGELALSLHDAGELRATISVGVASYPAHTESPAALLERADQQLYRAKRGGRNRVESPA